MNKNEIIQLDDNLIIDLDEDFDDVEGKLAIDKPEYSKEQEKKSSPKKKKIRRKGTIEIYLIAVSFIVVFALLVHNFYIYVQYDSEDFIYNSYNSRFATFTDNVIRGDILTADGKVIATTNTTKENEVREYPHAELFSHAVGYVNEGLSGLEAQYSFDLLKTHISMKEQVEMDLNGEKVHGDNLITTLDYDTQKAAYDAMGYFKGAVVAIDPETGKIVAMVSKPDFDPNTLDSYWDFITDKENSSSILLNRCTGGQYPPGSVFKIITTLAMLESDIDPDTYRFNCTGSLQLNDFTIHCSNKKAHGNQDLDEAFANSCNCAFADIGLKMDPDFFTNEANKLLFNTQLPTTLENVKESKFSVDKYSGDPLIGQTAMGQGDTLVTPLHMCMIVSAIANNGKLMEPYIVDRIETEDNFVVSSTEPVEYGQIMDASNAKIVKNYMSSVVEYGTAEKVDFGEDLTVYGKTGTAEYSSDKSAAHSWFVGFAENSSGKKLAVAVIMEGAGYGSKFAAPLAAQVFDAYLN